MRGLDPGVVIDFCGRMKLNTGELWPRESFQCGIIEELCAGETKVWLEVPEGNAKTTLAAMIALAHGFFVDDCEVDVGAASRDQTGRFLRAARGIVRRTDGFARFFEVQDGYRKIKCLRTAGEIVCHAADEGTGDGIEPTLVILDELHRHKNFGLYRTWNGKLLKRKAQAVTISTAGEAGGEYETVKAEMIRACEARGSVVREGAHTVARSRGLVLHRYGLDEGEDTEDLELVKLANPLAAITVAELKDKLEQPDWSAPHWARFVCGKPTASLDAAITAEEWDGLPRGQPRRGAPCTVGMDVAWKWDTFALTPFVFESHARRVFGRPEILIPPRNGIDSLSFEREVKPAFHRIHARNPIEALAYDPNAEANVVVEWAAEEFGCQLLDVSQSNVVQSEVYRLWMEAVRMGWIVHPHDLVMRAQVTNAIAKQIGGSHDQYRFTRPSTSRSAARQNQRVIDALIAASGAHWTAVAGLDEEPERPFDLDDYRIVRM